MTDFTWAFPLLEVSPKEAGKTNVVATVHWQQIATDGEVSARECGTLTVPLDPNAPFTPFDKLTEDVVVGWIVPRLDIAGMRRRLTNKLVALAPPKALTRMQPPWGA